MERKIICYGLHGAGSNNYHQVYEFIENQWNGTRATDSVYIIFSNHTNEEIADTLAEKFGMGVSLLVNDFWFFPRITR